MSISNVSTNTTTSSASSYTSTVTSKKNGANSTTNATASAAVETPGAVYEPSSNTTNKKATYVKIANKDLVDRMEADLERRTSQMKSLVEKLMLGQGKSIADATDLWSFLRKGNFEVDAETKAQAQKDISEGGYWSVENTSDRIVDFAVALAGDDKNLLSKMKDAFLKGYEKAEKTWGGELPEISQKTYDAVLSKFDSLLNDDKNDGNSEKTES